MAEGVGRAASFGASDVVLPALGVTDVERMKARKEESPVAEAIGETAGVLASLLVPGGALLGAGKLGAGVRGVARAGRAVEAAAARKRTIKKKMRALGLLPPRTTTTNSSPNRY